MHAASRRRQKDAFSILLRHQTHPDHVKHLSANHFQDGVNAYKYLKASSQTAEMMKESLSCSSQLVE